MVLFLFLVFMTLTSSLLKCGISGCTDGRCVYGFLPPFFPCSCIHPSVHSQCNRSVCVWVTEDTERCRGKIWVDETCWQDCEWVCEVSYVFECVYVCVFYDHSAECNLRIWLLWEKKPSSPSVTGAKGSALSLSTSAFSDSHIHSLELSSARPLYRIT